MGKGDMSRGKGLEGPGLRDENRRIRYLRLLTDLVHQQLCIQPMTQLEARESLADLRRAAVRMFPGKEGVFDLVIAPRLERVIEERFGRGEARKQH